MAYHELIKDFNRIRTYLRSFYVYGFRHREDFTEKSARSYDNERRRVESWLGDYMRFRQDEDGKRVFLSIDSRAMTENPLFRAFRTKSFTDGDIMLHFHVLDILKDSDGLSINAIMDELAERLSSFEADDLPDESTVRKKLKEYVGLGIIATRKRGRETVYVRVRDAVNIQDWGEAAAFFSEAAPLGVIGSFIQDKLPERNQHFRFKHHYILNVLESEILGELFSDIQARRMVSFTIRKSRRTVLPLKVFIGTRTGRQYLLAWSPESDRLAFHRIDQMNGVKTGDVFEIPADLDQRVADFCAHAWGVTGENDAALAHVEMTVCAGPGEEFIVQRLMREKRCGRVEQVDETHWRFCADVHDALEMLPWIRTFTGRVTNFQCSDQEVVDRFWNDLKELARVYGGGADAVS